jgi:hypothetical protein
VIHRIGEVQSFAEFCRANSPASVAAGILPGEVAEVRVCIADIREWLRQFFGALVRIESPHVAKHEPLAAASDICPDIPAFLDRRTKAPTDTSAPGMEVPAR